MNMMIDDDTRDALQIRAILDDCDKDDTNWIENRVKLALALKRGRKDRDNNSFGEWLARKGLDHRLLSRDDRAALLNVAEHTDLFRSIAGEGESLSVRLIWAKMQSRLSQLGGCRSAAITPTEPELPSDPTESAQFEQSANESAEPEQSPPPARVALASHASAGRPPLIVGLRGGDTILRIFTNKAARR